METELFIDFEGKEHVIIRTEEETYTSMPKAVWDAQEAAKEASGTLS